MASVYIDDVGRVRFRGAAARRRARGGVSAGSEPRERDGDTPPLGSGSGPRTTSQRECLITVYLWNLCEKGDCLDGKTLADGSAEPNVVTVVW